LALVRGQNPNLEFLDFYNNGYTGATNFGLRFQKRGTGEYRDYLVDAYDGTTYTNLNKITVSELETGGSPIHKFYTDVEVDGDLLFDVGADGKMCFGSGSVPSTGHDLYIEAETGSSLGGHLYLSGGEGSSFTGGVVIGQNEAGTKSNYPTRVYTSAASSSTYNIVSFFRDTTQISELRTNGEWEATDFVLSSDPKLKTEITSVSGALNIIQELNPVEYKWKDKRDDYFHIGYLTSDVKKVRPELVQEGTDYETLSYSRFTAINTAAIKELYEEVLELRSEIESLKKQIKK